MYEYKQDDCFYDVESLDNIFTVAFWFPVMNSIIISYIDDDHIVKSFQDLDYIRNYIYEKHPRLRDAQTQIVFENLSNTGCIKEFNTANPATGMLGLQSFAKRLGLANGKTYLNAKVDERGSMHNGLQYHPIFYPVKQTDPDYNEHRHGYRFGYNSEKYDTTILSHILASLDDCHFRENHINRPVMIDNNIPLTARFIRDFNNELFEDKWRNNMPMRLAHTNGSQEQDFQKPGWILRKAWLLTGRYIDVAKLNEKMSKIGLKRLLGMLGHQIMESEKLSHDSKIRNLEELADLIAYNISDVINLQKLFEHKTYQNSFNVRGKLLETYPQTIYAQMDMQAYLEQCRKKGIKPNKEAPADVGNYVNIRKDRLTRDSTSAKFVELAIAPYKPIKDIPKVSFLYPSELEAKKLGVKRTNILEDTKAFFEKNITNDPNHEAHQEFMRVYQFYKSIEGRNFNASDAYRNYYKDEHGNLPPELEPKDVSYIRQLMSEYNTNLFYYHKDENGNPVRSSCLVNFSIGGIHGAEINIKAFQDDLTEYYKEKELLKYVQDLYNGSALDAINGPAKIQIPDGFHIPKRLKEKIDENNLIKIREFLKSGSTKKKAEWREPQEVVLFRKNKDGKWEIPDKYTYVSVGPAHHEDFTSYYPLLLSRLSVFINPNYHGYEPNGDPKDPYYQMFLERLEKKKLSKDKSLPQEVRDLYDIEQDSRKLLINAASGAGDATFDNNIRANNAVISMRIIGQLFAWRIGQAQALAGARVPSTNTDGLYTMDISEEDNNCILQEVAKDMYIGIEPEPLDRFVSKDSNNRLEVMHNKIESAKGGTLNSWKGPEPTQSLDHPAIIDHVLAKYLAHESIRDPSNTAFNKDLAISLFDEFIQEHIRNETPQEALRFFQWILASSTNTHRYYFARHINKHTGEVYVQNMQHYNRIFLIKEGNEPIRTEISLATKSKINANTWKKRYAEYQKGERPYSDLWEHDPEALDILQQNGFDLWSHNQNPESEHYQSRATQQKVRSMPLNQHVAIYNYSIKDLPNEQAIQMLQLLDVDAYLEILEGTFSVWSNVVT